MKVIRKENYGLPVFSWCPRIEESAMSQIDNLASLPFAKHIAIMPDAHSGYGMPIGGVLATQGVVSPNAVGVDIGCGVSAFKTDIQDLDNSLLTRIIEQIKEQIPVGFDHRLKPKAIPAVGNLKVVRMNEDSAGYQVGTLGGGKLIATVLANN